MQVDAEMLQQITIGVCQSMLGLELSPINSVATTADQLVASVEIRGQRHCIIEVFAHRDLMASIAETMFSSDRGSLSEEEIRDAFCEIANMIGGNVKGAFGDDSADLSLPMFGSADNGSEKHAQGSVCITFDCCGHPLTIVLRDVVPKLELPRQIAVVST